MWVINFIISFLYKLHIPNTFTSYHLIPIICVLKKKKKLFCRFVLCIKLQLKRMYCSSFLNTIIFFLNSNSLKLF